MLENWIYVSFQFCCASHDLIIIADDCIPRPAGSSQAYFISKYLHYFLHGASKNYKYIYL